MSNFGWCENQTERTTSSSRHDTKIKTTENLHMKRTTNSFFGGLVFSMILLSASRLGAADLFIWYEGKTAIQTIDGNISAEVYCMTNITSDKRILGKYWVAISNSHLAVLTGRTNHIVQLADRLYSVSGGGELAFETGLTNVNAPLSIDEIRRYATPYFNGFFSGEYSSNLKLVRAEALLPKDTFGKDSERAQEMRGFAVVITNLTVTTTNLTIELAGFKNRRAVLVFDKDLNVVEARKLGSEEAETKAEEHSRTNASPPSL